VRQKRVRNAPKAAAAAPPRAAAPKAAAPKKRLSYKEQRELEAMPQTIDALEAQQKALQLRIAGRDFYRQDKAAIAETLALLEKTQSQLAAAYARWEQLEQGS
jgi:ABC transport system ATP-binding/permease protein